MEGQDILNALNELKVSSKGQIKGQIRVIDKIQSLHLRSIEHNVISSDAILVFVYHNDKTNKILALSLGEAKARQEGLFAEGWKRTATLDPFRWIQYLYN